MNDNSEGVREEGLGAGVRSLLPPIGNKTDEFDSIIEGSNIIGFLLL